MGLYFFAVVPADGFQFFTLRLSAIHRFTVRVGFFGGVVLGNQRLPVFNGNLIVVGMNFAKGEESVTVAAVIDKGRLQGWFNPGDFR